MNREETKDIMKVVSRVYPDFQKNASKAAKGEAVDIWTALFSEEPLELVAAATKAFIVSDIRGFAPSPGQIKEKIQMIKQPDTMTEVEAWSHIQRAMKNLQWDNPKAAWETLPEELQWIMPEQLKEWAMADISSLQVVASNVMRSYKAKTLQQKEYDKLPSDVKQISQMAAGMLAIEEHKED